MAHPLKTLAARLSANRRYRRNMTAFSRLQSDPHLARDLGLPLDARPGSEVAKW